MLLTTGALLFDDVKTVTPEMGCKPSCWSASRMSGGNCGVSRMRLAQSRDTKIIAMH